MSDTLKKRMTISLDYGLYAKLPTLNRSAFVERLISEHFLIQSNDKFYEYVKKRLHQDGYIKLPEPEKVFSKCCLRYPDLDCGHWFKNEDSTQAINKKNGEVREIGQW